MRIVAVADTHLFHGELAVPDGDVFVHAGDLCRGGDLDELREAAAWIAGLPHRHEIVIDGMAAPVSVPAHGRTEEPGAPP